MTNSTHKVEVIEIERIEPHPNADRLDVVQIYGYTTCVVRGSFQEGQLAAFIPPDSVVPETEAFAFLDGHRRIRAKKLRGIVSYGFLIPAPEGAEVGEDVAERLGVIHYEPPLPVSLGGDTVKAPDGYHPEYDVDALLRYPEVFAEGEPVWVTEKIHGANARFTCVDGELFAGSRTQWKAENRSSVWWRATRVHPEIEAFCRAHEGMTLYGEVYGAVQNLKYGVPGNQVRFAAFDILDGTRWLDPREGHEVAPELPWVPIVGEGVPYGVETLRELADGPSLMPGATNIREGIVVRAQVERTHPEIGRVCLKVVSATYLEKS
jgi:RNA ligase (TIGR02306 family)